MISRRNLSQPQASRSPAALLQADAGPNADRAWAACDPHLAHIRPQTEPHLDRIRIAQHGASQIDGY